MRTSQHFRLLAVNVPTEDKAKLSREIEEHTKAFLANGGTIDVLPGCPLEPEQKRPANGVHTRVHQQQDELDPIEA